MKQRQDGEKDAEEKGGGDDEVIVLKQRVVIDLICRGRESCGPSEEGVSLYRAAVYSLQSKPANCTQRLLPMAP